MSSYESLLEEYQEYVAEKKVIGTLGAAAAIAVGAGHFLNKSADAAPAVSKAPIDIEWNDDEEQHVFGSGDWAVGDVETPTDHPEDHDVEEPKADEPEEVKPTVADRSAFELSRENVDQLSMTLFGEARSESDDGMRAVANVILNRASHDRWKGSVKSVVRADRQFSCWNEGDPNKDKMQRMLEIYNWLRRNPEQRDDWMAQFRRTSEFAEFQQYIRARKIAKEVLSGEAGDNTGGSLFYHTSSIMPTWARGQQVIARIGNHQFYRTDRKA